MNDFDLGKFLEELEYMINTDSGSMDIEGNRRLIDFLKTKYDALGFKTTVKTVGENGRPFFFCENKPGQDYDYLFLGHVDTVFDKGTTATRPFTISEDGEKIYGPGTVDMKSGDLLIYYITAFLHKNNPDISICVAHNCDEEISSIYSADEIVKLGQKTKRCFVFEGARKKGQFVCERRGCKKYEINFSGIATHSGTAAEKGASAIVEMANWIVKLDKLKNYERGTAINVGIVQGGTALNVVPDSAKALMEVRYTDIKELMRIDKKIEELNLKGFVPGVTAKVKVTAHSKPLVLNDNTKRTMELMREAGNFIDFNVNFVKAGGLSDANRLSDLGISIIDGCGPGGGFPHSEDEFLSIETVNYRYKEMIHILQYIYDVERGE